MQSDVYESDRSTADGGNATRSNSGANRSGIGPDRADRSPTGTADTLRSNRCETSGKSACEESAREATADETRSAVGGTAVTDTSVTESASNDATSGHTTTSNHTTTSDEAQFDERLRAVERAVTGTDSSVADVSDEATAAVEREELEARLDDVEARIEELEAATQAIRGYAGSIRAVNREVERRADLALARASNGQGGDAGAAVADSNVSREASMNGASGEVPSEAALDAAVPSDSHRTPDREPSVRRTLSNQEKGDKSGGTSNDTGDGRDTDTGDDRSWRSNALDRLRESL